MLRTPSVCVVTAKPTFRRMLTHLLREKGFEVQDLVACNEPTSFPSVDIALVDYRNDACVGNDFCRQFKSAGHILVIALLEDGDADVIEQACDAGADSYLIKPLAPAMLLVRIIQLISTDTDLLSSEVVAPPNLCGVAR